MDMESLYYQKVGDELFRSVWFYFGMPPEYIKEIGLSNDKPVDPEFVFYVSKAVVIDILICRDLHGSIFESIFERCTKLDKDGLRELDVVIGSLINTKDTFSAFIRLCAILADFVLFLRYKGNFLKMDRQRLLLFFSEYYDGYFKNHVIRLGGLKTLTNTARERTTNYSHDVLKSFTFKYCNSNSPYNKENVPALFEAELRGKLPCYQPTFHAV